MGEPFFRPGQKSEKGIISLATKATAIIHAEDQKVTHVMATMNILNGGRHADNNADIQEFMGIPRSATSECTEFLGLASLSNGSVCRGLGSAGLTSYALDG